MDFKWFTRDDLLMNRRCREDIDPEIDRRKDQIRRATERIGRGTAVPTTGRRKDDA